MRSLSEGFVRSQGGAYARLVRHLVGVLLGSTDEPLRGDHVIAWLMQLEGPPVDAMGCSLAVHTLCRVGIAQRHEAWLRPRLKEAARRLFALPSPNDQDLYVRLSALVAVFSAAAQAGWLDDFKDESPRFRPLSVFLDLQRTLKSPFLRGRCFALMLSVMGGSDWQAMGGAGGTFRQPLADVLRMLDQACQADWSQPGDGIHEGPDYLLFPLSELLSAMAGAGLGDQAFAERDWVATARQLFARASLSSRCSQLTFHGMALHSLGLATPEHLRTLVLDTAGRYAASGLLASHDAYLRCTYLVTFADRLRCRGELSAAIEQRLAIALMSTHPAEPAVNPKYLRQSMSAAYLLYAASDHGDALGLARVAGLIQDSWSRSVWPWRDWGPIEFGHALVDAALDAVPCLLRGRS
ncbi:hypothetical protein [Aquabacterium sp.]|uniref:hypothetical protein n=1 Tax=Aquabacterium sp. TaxID=1872578 RepID=UPI003D6C7AAB